ncbi:uncharacterized protein N7529_009082 [Penicillium soppii]|uniref:uncharacterized protein n=1 Tax=Penicillium soppii TaxID=69789 RepID=UPI0025491B17|nr:uncharacterized protein N7529_009082 [Penicillium soppii]KAJ5861772.1 hypothetical protein N7529_009082 [Penicillium soppii]
MSLSYPFRRKSPILTRALIPPVCGIRQPLPVAGVVFEYVPAQPIREALVRGCSVRTISASWVCAISGTAHARRAADGDTWLVDGVERGDSAGVVADRCY